ACEVNRKLIYKRAEFYHKEYKEMYRREVHMGRIARQDGCYYVPAEPKLALAIRIREWAEKLETAPNWNEDFLAFIVGKHGVICVDDLIHEIYTAGKNFKTADNFLWPSKLSSPSWGYE
ncbi:hypothetical protein JZ751_003950, partial [Albula glossodonta]